MSRLDEIKSRLEAVTPGPWRWHSDDYHGTFLHGPEFNPENDCLFDEPHIIINSDLSYGEYEKAIEPNTPNAQLIAHAPEDIKFLITQLEDIQKREPDRWSEYRLAQSQKGNQRLSDENRKMKEQLEAAQKEKCKMWELVKTVRREHHELTAQRDEAVKVLKDIEKKSKWAGTWCVKKCNAAGHWEDAIKEAKQALAKIEGEK